LRSVYTDFIITCNEIFDRSYAVPKPVTPEPTQFTIAQTPLTAVPVSAQNVATLYTFGRDHTCRCCTAGAIIPPDCQFEADYREHILVSRVSLYAIVALSGAPLGVLGYLPNRIKNCATLQIHLGDDIREENFSKVVVAAHTHGLSTLKYHLLTCVVRPESQLQEVLKQCRFTFECARGENKIWTRGKVKK
jgi:hypothetical protein